MAAVSMDGAALCNNLALRKAARYLGAAYDKALAPVGLRGTQFSILQKLSACGETTITALAEVIAMDRTTMASNLKPLAREGLVTIEPSAVDRRARIVTLTPEGLPGPGGAAPVAGGAGPVRGDVRGCRRGSTARVPRSRPRDRLRALG
jgi:DNA-binding transcriptional ArsR family regulator